MRRLPKGLLPLMMHDADVEVRRVVAKRIGVDALVKMLQDDDPGVRLDAIERVPVSILSTLVDDADWRIRYEVAARGSQEAVIGLLADEDYEVRRCAAERLGKGDMLSRQRLPGEGGIWPE